MGLQTRLPGGAAWYGSPEPSFVRASPSRREVRFPSSLRYAATGWRTIPHLCIRGDASGEASHEKKERTMIKLIALVAATSLFAGFAVAEDAPPPKQTLFKNVKVFNGTDDKLRALDVLVENNLIAAVGKGLTGRTDAAIIGVLFLVLEGLFAGFIQNKRKS